MIGLNLTFPEARIMTHRRTKDGDVLVLREQGIDYLVHVRMIRSEIHVKSPDLMSADALINEGGFEV